MRLRPAAIVSGSALGLWVLITAAGAAPSAPKKAAKTVRPAKAAKPAGPDFKREVLPVVQKYCFGCHGPNQQIAGIGLHHYRDAAAVVKARETWEKVSVHTASHAMPPKEAAQPSPAERALLTGWIDSTLSQADCEIREPGRVTMRRLNRVEYNNTVRDLFGTDFRAGEDFPSDDVGYGYDNIGDVLFLSPLLMEKYLATAEKITEAAIVTDPTQGPTRRFEAERIPETGGDGVVNGPVRTLFSNGAVFVDFDFPRQGDYVLRVRAYGEQAGEEPAKLAFQLDGREVQVVDVAALGDAPAVYQAKIEAKPGKRRAAVAFTNDFYDRRSRDPKNRDRNLVVDYIEIAGPMEARAELPESHRRVFIAQPEMGNAGEAARQILGEFARRAYRRPVTAEEVDRLARVTELALKQGDSFERGIQLGLQAVLVSPHFLFRVEAGGDPAKPRPLNDYELASRLSYFLWSSMPDEELFALAAKGQLKKPEVLEAQAKRMLRDRKARALVENWVGQWLTLRNLQGVNPDRKRYPAFDEKLREAMLTETQLFAEEIIRGDQSVLKFLDADFTYLNERLAKHYGIDWVQGEQFRRVFLRGDQRGGVLTHASILTITSNPGRTSPVKRGKWILEQILGTPPPPPPPDVPELDEKKDMLTGTLRQRLEQHREDPGCASCHNRLDPLGFAFENFDAIGAWRTADGGTAVDASGTLPDGSSFEGPEGLKTVLLKNKHNFARNLVTQLATYALGRGLEHTDRCSVDDMARRVAAKGHKFSALVTEIVKSEPFRVRGGEGVQGVSR